MIKDYIKEMLSDDFLGVLKIRGGGSQQQAEKMANKLECAIGITKFLDKNDEFVYGVLIDKRKIKNDDNL